METKSFGGKRKLGNDPNPPHKDVPTVLTVTANRDRKIFRTPNFLLFLPPPLLAPI